MTCEGMSQYVILMEIIQNHKYQDENERNRVTMLQMRLNILAQVSVDPVNLHDK